MNKFNHLLREALIDRLLAQPYVSLQDIEKIGIKEEIFGQTKSVIDVEGNHWVYDLENNCWYHYSFGDIPCIEQQLEEDLADVEDAAHAETEHDECFEAYGEYGEYDAFEEERYRLIQEDKAEVEFAARLREEKEKYSNWATIQDAQEREYARGMAASLDYWKFEKPQ